MKMKGGGGKREIPSIRLHFLQIVNAPSIPPFSLFLSSHIVARKPFPCPKSSQHAHTCTCISVFVCPCPLGLLETRHGLPERCPIFRFGSKTCRSHYFFFFFCFFYSQHIRWLSLASAFQSTYPHILADSRTRTHARTQTCTNARTVSNDIKYPLKPCTHTAAHKCIPRNFKDQFKTRPTSKALLCGTDLAFG